MKKDTEKLNSEIDESKRETLAKLAKAAWVIPAVTTFGLGSLKSSSAWAQLANGPVAS